MLSDSENQYIFVKVSNCQFQHFRYLSVFTTGLVSICGRWSCVFDVAHPWLVCFLHGISECPLRIAAVDLSHLTDPGGHLICP